MHPDVQAQLILSIQEEKRQKVEARWVEDRRDDTRPWHAHLLSISGDALINTGKLLKRYAGLPEAAQPITNHA
jgi:hypothetical protein